LTKQLHIAHGCGPGVSGYFPGVPDVSEDSGTPLFLPPFDLLFGTFELPGEPGKASLLLSRVGGCWDNQWQHFRPLGDGKPAFGGPETAGKAVF